ncbi:hypothetical protein K458DRAFT_412779 [Lentithecium fluviatile CBS 122367]|uniref:Uncharacterized protein n=1 Tax=Lentithecium fluviatile CBS 122367 TaxID=1168545 RepID=A0A6G1JI54_9PLEO|nr:hypothetical protein K458DRAFT_412779 [Lentithecium fluviatile CBS 122367]
MAKFMLVIKEKLPIIGACNKDKKLRERPRYWEVILLSFLIICLGLLPHKNTRPNSIPPSEQTLTEYDETPSDRPHTATGNTATSASLEGVADVFGEYMYRVIRRVTVFNDRHPTLKANVTIQFPGFALHDCVLMLEICEIVVEHLVKDLSGITVMSVIGILSKGSGSFQETAFILYVRPGISPYIAKSMLSY